MAKKIETEKVQQETKSTELDFSKKKSLFDVKGWFQETKFNANTSSAYSIEVFNRNGTKSFYIIFANTDSFVLNKKRYIIDEQYKWYNNTTKNWALTYHEDISTPLSISVDTFKIKKSLEAQSSEVRSAINPESLEIYMKSSFVQKIMQGEEMDKIFKRLILLGMVSAIASVILLVIYVQQSGALSGLGF